MTRISKEKRDTLGDDDPHYGEDVNPLLDYIEALRNSHDAADAEIDSLTDALQSQENRAAMLENTVLEQVDTIASLREQVEQYEKVIAAWHRGFDSLPADDKAKVALGSLRKGDEQARAIFNIKAAIELVQHVQPTHIEEFMDYLWGAVRLLTGTSEEVEHHG